MMNLARWLKEGKLKPHITSQEEITALLELSQRDIKNASIEALTPDWRFSIAYNAALNLATIPLLLAGYRTVPAKGGHHYITFALLLETIGPSESERINYLQSCRNKRHSTTYDSANLISEKEVEELLEEVQHFLTDIQDWLSQKQISIDSSH